MYRIGSLSHTTVAPISPSPEHFDTTSEAFATHVSGADHADGSPHQFTPIGFATTERVQLMIAQRLTERGREYKGLERGARHFVAIQNDNGAWAIVDNHLAEPQLTTAEGTYLFVRMMNGEIRVGRGSEGRSFHGELSNCAPFVAYAGRVTFNQGRIVEFSNASGTYHPPAELRAQSGFDHDATFKAQ